MSFIMNGDSWWCDMVSFKMEGLDKLIELCELTEKQTDKICGRAIYPGGGLMYEEALGSTKAIITDDDPSHKRMRRGPTTAQKEALIESLGIAPIRKPRWGMNVKIGYDGYNDIKTAKYPKGQPNMMIARSVESGTTFMYPQYFMDRAVRSALPRVEKAIGDQFSEELIDIWGKK